LNKAQQFSASDRTVLLACRSRWLAGNCADVDGSSDKIVCSDHSSSTSQTLPQLPKFSTPARAALHNNSNSLSPDRAAQRTGCGPCE
jgi:hypothetical protein